VPNLSRNQDSPDINVLAHTSEATEQLGAAIGRTARPGDVIRLDGTFGAGKTTFARGIARGLGVTGDVTSPSFSLVHEYGAAEGARVPFFHADLYRLGDADEVASLGLDDAAPTGVLAIEWGWDLVDALPAPDLIVELRVSGDDGREIRFHGFGRRGQALLTGLTGEPFVVRRAPGD